MSSPIRAYLFYACAILLLLSAALYITGDEFVPHRVIYYVYAISGAGVAVAYLSNPYRGENRRLKRLNTQLAIAAILLPVSSFLMWKGKNEWFVFLFVSAFLQLYVTIIKIREEKKEENKT
jgi:peptidoglycan/LPS O-acetylase OafA/YrhL